MTFSGGFGGELIIFGLKYSLRTRTIIVLLNFIFANVKMAIWRSGKNRMLGTGLKNPVLCFRGLNAARLKVEHAYYKLTENIPGFFKVWGLNNVLCSVDNNDF